MSRRRIAILTLIVLAVAAPRGQCRQDARPVPLEPPLDEAVEDRNVLARSLRLVDPGLALPDDFGQVYRVPGRQDLLMRIQGGLYAVFPYSVYKRDKKGRTFADVPSGTIFHIGGPPRPEPDPAADALFSDRLETRLPPQPAGRVRFGDAAAPATASGMAPAAAQRRGEPVTLPAIVADPEYRARRMRELAAIAAAACAETAQAALGRSSSSK